MDIEAIQWTEEDGGAPNVVRVRGRYGPLRWHGYAFRDDEVGRATVRKAITRSLRDQYNKHIANYNTPPVPEEFNDPEYDKYDQEE